MAQAARASVSRDQLSPDTRTRLAALVAQCSAPAWGAIGVTVAFLAITLWWLTQDSSIPIFDAGLHLQLAMAVHRELGAGHLAKALTLSVPYPPFAYLIGSLGIAVGGLGVTPMVLTENLVFVPLLALGCYHVGKLAFGATAGLLAVVFALGSPLIIAQFHVFMTDAPETSMVAVAVWLILATEGFSRVKLCALAGVVVGLGMLTKEPFAIFVIGPVGVTAWRGGRQAWRGFAVFAVIALVIGLPWYIKELSQLGTLGGEATSTTKSLATYGIPDVAPPRLSLDNLTWYLWSMINSQLYLPLFLLAGAGWVWTLQRLVRRLPASPLAVELMVGAFVAWLVLTETFIHDERYGMPLLLYLSVFAAGWIVSLRGRLRIAGITALALIALLNTLGSSFSAGPELQLTLPGATTNTLQKPGVITVAQNQGFLVDGPRRDGDLVAMFEALRRNGVRLVAWPVEQSLGPDFSTGGVSALAEVAGLTTAVASSLTTNSVTRADAFLSHGKIGRGEPTPCVTLDDGTGVWVRVGNPEAPGAKDYCPLPKPHYYG
jgi:Dolichyl-phosphate-mannose-protein mannosyltransferase